MEAVQAQVLSHYRSELVDRIRARGHWLSADGMTIRLAKEFGFCYGVERAIDLAYAARKVFPHQPIYILGEIIHNPEVNDQLRDYWGKLAIRQWAAQDIVAQSLTMEVTTVIEHYGNFIVTANVRGKFDMTGLPDPLVYAFYFTAHGDRIVQLIILRNRYDV